MARVTLNAVKKTYPNGFAAIHGVDLDVADSEFIVLVGPSGCGKSTLLRMVAGLETVSQGQISIDGNVVNELEPAQRDIAMVFQNYALYPHMKVFDNMAYGLRNRGVAKPEIERRVKETARILELDALLDRRPRQLSGGQRQRVAMGRAIVREPKAFLFDEPLSNLDAKLRVQMRIEIKRLQRQFGITSLYVTHDQVEAMTLADRLVVMNAGHAEQIGTPLEVYQRPATVFVASFIGSPAMNFISGAVDAGAVSVNGSARLPAHPAKDMAGPITVGIRPEHLELVEDAAADLLLVIDLVEPLGADTLVHGHVGASDTCGQTLTLRLNGISSVRAGETLPLRATPEHIHLFDADSGVRIERAP